MFEARANPKLRLFKTNQRQSRPLNLNADSNLVQFNSLFSKLYPENKRRETLT
jgi:hypothetical protein